MCGRSRVSQPAQKKRPWKFRIETRRPITRDVGKFERVLLPVEMGKRGVSLFEKLRERGVLWEKRQRPQSFGGRLRFVVHARGAEFAQQFEIVQQHLFVTFVQDFFENLPADFGRYDRWVGQRQKLLSKSRSSKDRNRKSFLAVLRARSWRFPPVRARRAGETTLPNALRRIR